MTMYTLYVEGHVQRDDGAIIPPDPENLDWQTYQLWLLDGNTPDPLPPPPVQASESTVAESAQSLLLAQAKSLASQGRTKEALEAIVNLLEGATS